jgi:hypothetical protein
VKYSPSGAFPGAGGFRLVEYYGLEFDGHGRHTELHYRFDGGQVGYIDRLDCPLSDDFRILDPDVVIYDI